MSSVVSNLVDKVKGKKSDDSAPDSSKGEEPAYSIQPHPAVRVFRVACEDGEVLMCL
jgi:hypothetical protein